MSLFAELQRRKVFRVAGAYAVVGWLVIEVAATIAPQLNLPDWVPRLITFVILLGFPVAVVMAWVFDMTPEGIKVEASGVGSKRIFTAAAVLAALALGWYIHERPAASKPAAAPNASAAAVVPSTPGAAVAPPAPAVDPRSIAVLPFLNMSADKANEYFSDGISEELLNVLVRVNGFSVASRTSSFAFKGREVGTPEIAKELKVKYVLEGSVRKQGDEVRITAQLIDAIDDRHLWSQTYDRKLADIFKIQSDIANAIVAAVGSAMGAPGTEPAVTVKADTANLNAYDSYLKARELFLARTDLKESVRLYEHAVQLDPKFARGWEGLAAVYSVMRGWGFVDRDYRALADSAAKRALELDPNLSMAWAALASIETDRMPADWASSIEKLDRAIAADPHNSSAFLWRSIDWLNLGFFDRALADLDQCLQLDPHYGNCSVWKAIVLLNAGEPDRALTLFEESFAAGYRPHHETEFMTVAARRGNSLPAALWLDGRRFVPGAIKILIAAMSHPEAAHPTVAQFLETYDDTHTKKATDDPQLCLWLGDFDCVGNTKSVNGAYVLQWNPEPPRWRNSSGFKKLIVRLGVADYWRKKGFPPHCHAVGANDFSCDAPKPEAAK